MDTAKKQRQPKGQRDRRKAQEKEVETQNISKPELNDKGTDSQPQPQRANRRQRNEPTAPNNVQGTTAAPQEKKEPAENVVIDFSNLKRETEEIAKLTKKYTKREITSNWHRYSAPESILETEKTEEDSDVRADFSELLQVPVSRGGHLQLKEEQDWSSASGSELSGYFALDLKLLNQSLACLPIHEQLRLPRHLFTEEELNHYDSLANQAKKCYNPDKIEDPNAKVLKTILLNKKESESDKSKISNLNVDKPVESFNILDVGKSTEKLLNMFVESENDLNKQTMLDLDIVSNAPSNVVETVDFELKQKGTVVEENQQIFTKNKDIRASEKSTKIEALEILLDNTQEKSIIENGSKIENIPQYINGTQEPESNNKIENTIVEKPVLQKNKEAEIDSVVKEREIKHNEFNKDAVSTSESKRKQTNRNNDRKSPGKDTNKLSEKSNNIKPALDEDDDLDFLLSLKKPVPAQTKKESKPAVIKESSLVPGAATVPKTTAQQQHSELDDWLDSVLED